MTEIKWRSDMKVELIDSMGSDETVARAARVSTGRDRLKQDKIEGLIGYLMRNRHTSCFEHCVVTVRMNVPIFVHRQLMTHRTISKNSESGRYTQLEPHFYIPEVSRPLENLGSSAHPKFEENLDKQTHRVVVGSLKAAYKESWFQYEKLVNVGIANEVARDVLPVGIYTSVYMTANLLGWFNFLRLRNGSEGHPQTEIVEVATKVEKIIEELYPITYAAWRKSMV